MKCLLACAFFVNLGAKSSTFSSSYTLQEAISAATLNDPWLVQSRQQQDKLEALSISAGTLPDPVVNIGLANLPIDTFDLNQEPMTQVKLGVSQMFPRGSARRLQREKFARLSQAQPIERADRIAQASLIVTQLWLDAYQSKSIIAMIEKDRHLFTKLIELTESMYTTTAGITRQKDVIRAQVELTKLDDRLQMLEQEHETNLAKLSEWLPGTDIAVQAQEIPDLKIVHLNMLQNTDAGRQHDVLARLLTEHPRIKIIDQMLRASQSDIQLSKQAYKPQWGINASYGYRDSDPQGMDRSDFFSAGVSMDVPLFNRNRQDQQVKAAVADREILRTKRVLALRQLRSQLLEASAENESLEERKILFKTRLIPNVEQQNEAVLSAYTNDDGDFEEVVRAQIALLDARIDMIRIETNLQKSIAQLNYFLIGTVSDTLLQTSKPNNNTAISLESYNGK